MTTPPQNTPGEHALDVLRFLTARQAAGYSCALVMLTGVDGGAVRAPGALMAVTGVGETCGYVSGGCIDADVALQAQTAINAGKPLRLRYGEGSPFMDIRLPCGGAIELCIVPFPPMPDIKRVVRALENRRPASFALTVENETFTAEYRPKLRLRIAGRGADPLALARLTLAGGMDAELWSADEACLDSAAQIEGLAVASLSLPSTLPEISDDNATAFVLMMHDQDWETALLGQALAGNAFYVGAVGSMRAHEARSTLLLEQGASAEDIRRIHGPAGLVPSLRDASMLGVSVLAEIVAVFHPRAT